jgi:hypothetical protein
MSIPTHLQKYHKKADMSPLAKAKLKNNYFSSKNG